MYSEEVIDVTKLRYVLYARKSTEDESRQVRSISDQIADCTKLATDLGLNIVQVVEETKSAKKPNLRPAFSQLLNDIEAGKIDAIICWQPDRLCRNMREGGVIIDMLDEGLLKDLKFCTYGFTNDTSGKAMLGVQFVFAKQYSDDLSTKVGRGIRGNFAEGKSSGAPKFGYDRDQVTGLYKPNEHFSLIQKAWQLRAGGESVAGVTQFLEDNGFVRQTKNIRKPRAIKPNKSKVARMFHDPFYYGVLVQANQSVDLRELYDFEPMITEDVYNRVQELGYQRSKSLSPKKRTTFFPLRGFVYCAVCNSSKHMVVGKNLSGKKVHVLSYRCDNPNCQRKPKSLRAQHVFNSIYEKLEELNLSDEAYARYSKQIDITTSDTLVKLKEQVHSLRGALAHVNSDVRKYGLSAATMDKTSPIFKITEEKVEELLAKQRTLESNIRELESKVVDPRQIKLTKNEFLNLLKSAATKAKSGTAIEKDALLRILFLNVKVDNEKVVEYLWREPFASLVKAIENSSGRGDRT